MRPQEAMNQFILQGVEVVYTPQKKTKREFVPIPQRPLTESQQWFLDYINARDEWQSPKMIGLAYRSARRTIKDSRSYASSICRLLWNMGHIERSEKGNYRRLE